MNQDDPCVVTKMVNGKQMPIIWHVDNYKISNVDEKELTQIIKWRKSTHGKYIQVPWGNNHGYLVMDLDLYITGDVRLNMVDYLRKLITDFLEEIMRIYPTLSGNHLFKLCPNKENKILDEEHVT